MSISFQEAITLIEDSSKFQHSLLVSRIMKNLAAHFKTSEKHWFLVGLLHDIDYDLVDDYSRHGFKAAELLKDKLPVDAIHAIMAHDYRTGVKSESLLDDALIFADSLAIFFELSGDNDEGQFVFKERPWLWDNLIGFSDKHDLDILTIIEQLVI